MSTGDGGNIGQTSDSKKQPDVVNADDSFGLVDKLQGEIHNKLVVFALNERDGFVGKKDLAVDRVQKLAHLSDPFAWQMRKDEMVGLQYVETGSCRELHPSERDEKKYAQIRLLSDVPKKEVYVRHSLFCE